jgi:Ca2+/H+ antiporter
VFRKIICLFLILAWCELFVVVMCVAYICLHAYIVIILPTLDAKDTECTKEGEVFEYQEEDQGHADQGKPSNLIAYLILILIIACFMNIYENVCFYIAITFR